MMIYTKGRKAIQETSVIGSVDSKNSLQSKRTDNIDLKILIIVSVLKKQKLCLDVHTLKKNGINLQHKYISKHVFK